jgi:hypothetical protein
MAALSTVPQHFYHSNFTSIIPHQGVVTLSGYGISVRVDRGHLVLADGVGRVRREGRFARVGHGLRRLIVIGSDGMVSLEALRWLADQSAAFVMLDRIGDVLATTGPVRPSDARFAAHRRSLIPMAQGFNCVESLFQRNSRAKKIWHERNSVGPT